MNKWKCCNCYKPSVGDLRHTGFWKSHDESDPAQPSLVLSHSAGGFCSRLAGTVGAFCLVLANLNIFPRLKPGDFREGAQPRR